MPYTPGKVFNVPIMPHLKKFILQEYYPDGDPIKVEEDSLLGKHIMSILIDKRQVYSARYDGGGGAREYTETLKVILSGAMLQRSPRINRLARLNLEFDHVFFTSMFVWIKSQYSTGIPASQALKNFLDHYKITDSEYTWDAGYRAWQRHKNKSHNKRSKKERAKS